jgi:hypothetical protein
MTADEILLELENKGIIVLISGEYLLTERYKELLLPSSPKLELPTPLKKVNNYDALLNSSTNGSDWPMTILESKGRARAVAFMNACEIPVVAASKGYRLRGVDLETINILGNIIEDKNIDPNTFIDAVRLYYKYTECPKGIKNLVGDGDILDIYNEHIEGGLVKSLNVGPQENKWEWQ